MANPDKATTPNPPNSPNPVPKAGVSGAATAGVMGEDSGNDLSRAINSLQELKKRNPSELANVQKFIQDKLNQSPAPGADQAP